MPADRSSVVLPVEVLNQLHDTERTQLMRQHHKKSACTNVTSSGFSRYADQFSILDDVHQVIYAYIPKSGCSSWKTALVKLSNRTGNKTYFTVHRPKTMTKYGFRFLSNLNSSQRQYALSTYKSFVFVRHPLDRLLSAFREKFEHFTRFHERFQKIYAPTILRNFRPGVTDEVIAKGKGVTFKEFVQYVIRQHKIGGHMNVHWMSYWDLCRPCQRHYDFIGKIETMTTDADYVLRTFLGHNDPPKFPQRNSLGESDLQSYFDQLEEQEVESLIEVYKKDFEIFGYEKTVPLY